MAITAAAIVDGDREMILYPRMDDGLVLLGIDAPGPGIRAVSTPRTDDDGEDDTTELYGATSCAVRLLATATPAAWRDELGGYLHPASRPYLVVSDDEWAQVRRLRLRSSDWSDPRDADQAPEHRNILVQWRVPDGGWEADDEATVTLSSDIPSSVGFSFPITFPLTLDATSSGGSLQTVNVGNAPAHIVARLYGPCSAPRLINDSTGEEIVFTTDLVLTAGQYIEISTRNKTAYLLSEVTASRTNMIDFSANTWWQLQKGLQSLRFTGTDSSTGSQAVIYYRPVWL
jgi:hypothetical protein